jgi:hypothetical protein
MVFVRELKDKSPFFGMKDDVFSANLISAPSRFPLSAECAI